MENECLFPERPFCPDERDAVRLKGVFLADLRLDVGFDPALDVRLDSATCAAFDLHPRLQVPVFCKNRRVHDPQRHAISIGFIGTDLAVRQQFRELLAHLTQNMLAANFRGGLSRFFPLFLRQAGRKWISVTLDAEPLSGQNDIDVLGKPFY